jgi:hypothetical protein
VHGTSNFWAIARLKMTAAKVVTRATSPINFYCRLTQAGTAIASASAPDPWTVGGKA